MANPHCRIGKVRLKVDIPGAFTKTMIPAASGRGYVIQHFRRASPLEWVPITTLEYTRSIR